LEVIVWEPTLGAASRSRGILEAEMHISSVQIENYKSYRSSTTLKLMPGINVITGQNNAGKTALLEALRMDIQNNPHRSLTPTQLPDTNPNNSSTTTVTISIDRGSSVPATDSGIPLCVTGSVIKRNR
jgi:chromosome segregation ATPase